MAHPKRIVICDAAAQRARAFAAFVEPDPHVEVVAVFGGLEAMLSQLAELGPDLIALDVETGGADLCAAIESIMRRRPAPVLLTGGRPGPDDRRVAAALAIEAVEATPRGRLHFEDVDGVWATALRSRIRRLANVRMNRDGDGDQPAKPGSRSWQRLGASYRAIGIGASVGGPPALAALLAALPREFPLPILVVQHMASGFGEGLAKWLDRNIAMPVALASDGAPLEPGVWMAPEGAHLCLGQTMRLRLDCGTDRGAHRPSIDVLFESLATVLGAEAVGVVLTGMGRDGALGVRALAAAGGLTLAQDEETSAVFGMPGAAIEEGVDCVLPLEDLGPKLAALRVKAELR